MDELEIGGKRYLSSRRAAKEHRYHIDYIGQLIRAGRVTGKKVGRSWYVEEGSLNTYLKQEAAAPGYIQPAPIAPDDSTAEEVAEVTVAEELPPIEEQAVFAENNEVSEIAAAQVSAPQAPGVVEEEVQPAPVPAPIQAPVVLNQYSREQKVNLTIVEKKPAALTYIEDTEPLLPALEYKTPRNADFVPVIVRKTVRVVETPPVAAEIEQDAEEEEEYDSEKKSSPRRFTLGSAIALAVIGLVVLAGAFGVSAVLGTSVNIVEGKPASVSFTIK